MGKNKLFKAIILRTSEQVRVYKLGSASKQAGNYCDYDNMSNTYKPEELRILDELKIPA